MNILIIYYNLQYPLRPTLSAGLNAFSRYSDHQVFMWNAALRRRLGFLRRVRFDLVIFSTIFLSQHWGGPDHFTRITRRVQDIKRLDAVKIALPQDEFYHADLYSEFCNDFHIDAIYSVAPQETWPHIYRHLTYAPRFYRILTGYVDECQICPRPFDGRSIDIGYRTIGKPTPVYGTFGFRKWTIADRFLEAAQKRRLRVDISTNDREKFVGDTWYRFLADCKYVLGVESGTSIVDQDGSVTRAVNAFLRIHPGASFNVVAKACFDEVDGKVLLRAIGPRHLEACLTKTCQILIEGEYNGILRPWEHYIPVKSDFSDIEKILDIVERDDRREEIVTNAWRDVIATGRYTFRGFVSYVLETAMTGHPTHEVQEIGRRIEFLAYSWNRILDSAGWFLIRLAIGPWYRIKPALRILLSGFPLVNRVLGAFRARLE